MNDWIGFVLCLAYIVAVIGTSEALRRRFGYGSGFTRKFIHIGVGMLSWLLPFLFNEPWLFILACAIFMVINLLDWRYGLIKSMASSSRSNLGTVYFPLAAAVVVYVFWDYPPLMVAALMPLTWGDGLAPVVGKLYGRRSYSVHTSTRTVEGSMAFAVAGFTFTWLALWIMPAPPSITPLEALLPALIITAVTTLIEAVSIWGLDNLTITAAAILILSVWPFGA